MYVRILIALFIIGAGYGYNSALAESQEWKTGKKLTKSLLQDMSVSWQPAPIGDRLRQLAIRQEIAIAIDRRVDPTQLVSIENRHITFEQLLWTVTSANNLGVCRLGDVYYVGPKSTCDVLPIIYEETKKKLTSRRRSMEANWLSRKSVAYPRLNQPKQNVVQIGAAQEIEFIGLDKIPFDLRPELNLPSSNVLQQIIFQVVGFGLWPEVSKNGKSVELVEFPAPRTGEIRVRGIKNAKSILSDLVASHPSCKISASSTGITARGTPKELGDLRSDLVNRQKPRASDSARERFSLKTKDDVRGSALQSVADQLGVKLTYTPETQADLQKRITLNIVNETVDQLIQKVIGPELKYELSTGVLAISK